MKKSFIFLVLACGFYAVGNMFILQGEWWGWFGLLFATISISYRDKLFLEEETEEIEPDVCRDCCIEDHGFPCAKHSV